MNRRMILVTVQRKMVDRTKAKQNYISTGQQKKIQETMMMPCQVSTRVILQYIFIENKVR